MRRLVLVAVLAALLAVPVASTARPAAEVPPRPDANKAADKEKVKIDKETKAAVDLALKFLASKQDTDGSWGNTAVTGFVLLAFMSNGHVPNQGDYGKVVASGVRHLLAAARDDGYIVGSRGGNMYLHRMRPNVLPQVYGMTGDEDVKKVNKKAIDLIVKTQNSEGGWRYDPSPTGADISVTIMQVMALRGAKDAGLQVPDKVMSDSIKYINRCFDPRTGGYKYQPYSSGPGYARTAARSEEHTSELQSLRHLVCR